ncbi:NADP-dependent oxidoreductase [Bailinhaonella thermotolerans]|uniref:NADP-dependent oxidoreductase n=1 Tax=Bailinhaonella thermotolerans TaxID=1070861 RepID=A0A3A4ACZ2_9ACTN|nr:NADP-dependent oxidoreductase [Bailinhaonella thermotolerans]RJL27176.1 NADP-dependent oxidoreductase [Bailinhaonella thermotolerans]
MRAVAFGGFGERPELTDLPVPEPGPGEVLVEVRASTVNGFDLAVLGGYLKGAQEHEFPVVLGKDFAGVVAAVGEGVESPAVGQEVFGVVMRPTLGQGAFAEYVVVPAAHGVAPVPAGLSLPRAAALGLAATTALNAVDAVSPGPGEVVLVSGATGGVGGYAVQLAAARGAVVLATAKPGPEAAFVTGLGAAHTVDHTGDLAAQVRALAPGGLHAALHLAGDGDAIAALLADGGRFASTIHHTPELPSERGVTTTTIMADPRPDTLAHLAAEAAAGRLRTPISRTYPLSEALEALATFPVGTVGKLCVTV